MDSIAVEKENVLHRLSKDDEICIYALAEDTIRVNAGDTVAVRAKKAKQREALDAFKLAITHTVNGRPSAKGLKRLCYEHLPEILRITGLSYLDLLHCTSKNVNGEYVEPRWSAEEEKAMCAYCDILSPAQQDAVLELVRRILPAAYQSNELADMTPIMRLSTVNAMRAYCAAEQKRQTKHLGVYEAYRRRLLPYSYNAIELSMVPYIAAGFDVSPHWLLGLDESYTVLAASGKTETIMDLFCLLEDSRKQTMLQAVRTAIEGGASV